MGGGIGIGNTCKSMADSFQCVTKPTTTTKKKKKKRKKEITLMAESEEELKSLLIKVKKLA